MIGPKKLVLYGIFTQLRNIFISKQSAAQSLIAPGNEGGPELFM
jgi:hypothetical protein